MLSLLLRDGIAGTSSCTGGWEQETYPLLLEEGVAESEAVPEPVQHLQESRSRGENKFYCLDELNSNPMFGTTSFSCSTGDSEHALIITNQIWQAG